MEKTHSLSQAPKLFFLEFFINMVGTVRENLEKSGNFASWKKSGNFEKNAKSQGILGKMKKSQGILENREK